MPRHKKIDHTGLKYGMLTVLGLSHISETGSHRFWNCVCECGNTKVANGQGLASGHIRDCGCIRQMREYNAWYKMTRRCTDPNDPAWKYYGGRGIKVDPSWMDFRQFIKDMGPRPTNKGEHLSIERMNGNGNYCPENCKWATRKEQMNNLSSNVRMTLNGHVKTAAQWSELLEMPPHVIYSRKSGMDWPDELVLTLPWKDRGGIVRHPKPFVP